MKLASFLELGLWASLLWNNIRYSTKSSCWHAFKLLWHALYPGA